MILEKLIAREWFKSFFVSLFVLITLVAVANLVSELLRDLVPVTVILQNFLLDVPRWSSTIIPLCTMLATLFSLNHFQQNNELVAILSLGIERSTFLVLLFCFSFIISSLGLFLTGVMAPYSNRLKLVVMEEDVGKFRSNKSYGIKASTMISGKVWYRSKGKITSFQVFDKNNLTITGPTIYYYNDKSELSSIVYAKKATGASMSREWLLEEVKVIKELDKKEIFPQEELIKEIKWDLHETPEDFKKIETDVLQLDLIKLYKYIKKIEMLGLNTNEYRVFFYDKIASSLISMVFVFLTTQGLFSPGRRQSKIGFNILFILIFTLVYWFSYSSCQAMGIVGKLPPFVAVFLVPFIALLGVISFLFRHRHLS